MGTPSRFNVAISSISLACRTSKNSTSPCCDTYFSLSEIYLSLLVHFLCSSLCTSRLVFHNSKFLSSSSLLLLHAPHMLNVRVRSSAVRANAWSRSVIDDELLGMKKNALVPRVGIDAPESGVPKQLVTFRASPRRRSSKGRNVTSPLAFIALSALYSRTIGSLSGCLGESINQAIYTKNNSHKGKEDKSKGHSLGGIFIQMVG